MFCKYCGEKLDDKILEEKHIAYCPGCGKVNKMAKGKEKETKGEEVKELKDLNIDEKTCETKIYEKDSGSVGWGILGFLFPIVGLILYLCWVRTSPRSANSAGAGALICVVLCILATLVFAILSMFTNIQLPAEFYY